jgi:hypothetical protein
MSKVNFDDLQEGFSSIIEEVFTTGHVGKMNAIVETICKIDLTIILHIKCPILQSKIINFLPQSDFGNFLENHGQHLKLQCVNLLSEEKLNVWADDKQTVLTPMPKEYFRQTDYSLWRRLIMLGLVVFDPENQTFADKNGGKTPFYNFFVSRICTESDEIFLDTLQLMLVYSDAKFSFDDFKGCKWDVFKVLDEYRVNQFIMLQLECDTHKEFIVSKLTD